MSIDLPVPGLVSLAALAAIITITVGAGVVIPKNVSFILVHSGVKSNIIGSVNGNVNTNIPNGNKNNLTISAFTAKIMGILAKNAPIMAAENDFTSPGAAIPSF